MPTSRCTSVIQLSTLILALQLNKRVKTITFITSTVLETVKRSRLNSHYHHIILANEQKRENGEKNIYLKQN